MELALAALIGSLGLGLEVDAPPGCITAAELEAAVEEEIGPFVANVQIAIAKDDRGWRARIDRRVIEEPSDDCRALDRALVLVVALMAEPPPVRVEIEAPAVEAVEDRIANVRVGVDAALAVGALPSPSPGGRISGAVGFPLGPLALWIETGFTAWKPIDETIVQTSQTLQSSMTRYDGDLELCALVPLDGAIEFGACAGARLGRLHVGGEIDGTRDPYFVRGGEDSAILLAITAEVRAAWRPIDGLVAVLAVGGSIDLLDNAIYLADLPELSGNPADRVVGVFRAGAHWEVW